jgi:hypothetical protein
MRKKRYKGDYAGALLYTLRSVTQITFMGGNVLIASGVVTGPDENSCQENDKA